MQWSSYIDVILQIKILNDGSNKNVKKMMKKKIIYMAK